MKAAEDARRGVPDPPTDEEEKAIYFDAYVTALGSNAPKGCCE